MIPEALAADSNGELRAEVPPEDIVEVCRYLKEERGFSRVAAVTAVDRFPNELRFEVVYLLHAPPGPRRVMLKCRLRGDAAEIDSVCGVWRGAEWYETEIFDLFGIRFRNHPGLRRIMMPENWEGHPLRKDYPKAGKYGYQGEALS